MATARLQLFKPESKSSRTEPEVFNLLKIEINKALERKYQSIINDNRVLKFQNDVVKLSKLWVSHVNAICGQPSQAEEKEHPLHDTGIHHIINYINITINKIKMPFVLTPNEINELAPLHQIFFGSQQLSLLAQIKIVLLGLAGTAGLLGSIGYSAYSVYSSPDSEGVKNSLPYVATAAGLLFCTPRLILAVFQAEQMNQAKNLFGEQFETVKSLCAEYHELTNGCNAESSARNLNTLTRKLG